MKKLGGVLVVCLLAAACHGKKKEDRRALCRAGKAALVERMTAQIDQADEAGNKDAAEILRKVVTNAESRFEPFCNGLTDAEVECVSRGAAAIGDPACKSAVDKMKKDLLGI